MEKDKNGIGMAWNGIGIGMEWYRIEIGKNGIE